MTERAARSAPGPLAADATLVARAARRRPGGARRASCRRPTSSPSTTRRRGGPTSRRSTSPAPRCSPPRPVAGRRRRACSGISGVLGDGEPARARRARGARGRARPDRRRGASREAVAGSARPPRGRPRRAGSGSARTRARSRASSGAEEDDAGDRHADRLPTCCVVDSAPDAAPACSVSHARQHGRGQRRDHDPHPRAYQQQRGSERGQRGVAPSDDVAASSAWPAREHECADRRQPAAERSA